MNKLISFLVVFLLSTSITFAHEWSQTGSSIYNEMKGLNVSLLTDGRVMTIGGYTPSDRYYEVFDPATGTWPIYGLLAANQSSNHNIGILLYDGRVLFAKFSGFWRYRPRTNNWDTSAVDPGWTDSYPYTLLKNGDMLGIYDQSGEQGMTFLYHPAADAIEYVGNAPSRHDHGSEVLLPSGNVLVTGDSYSGGYEASIYNHVAKTWSAVASMAYPRDGHVSVLLPIEYGNKVLAVGGGAPGSKCELYDIGMNTWTPITGTELTYTDRCVSTMALLPEGKALLMGGDATAERDKCELYDPTTQSWSITDTMAYQRSHFSAIILATGKILAIGAFFDSIGARIPEIYDNTNGYWDARTPLQTARCYAAVTMLPIIHTTNCSTNVLISGGENGSGALSSCELYNYRENTIQYTGALNTARTHHTANLLMPSTEQVLIAGGRNGGGALNTSELYNLSNGTWSYTAGPMNNARYDHTATMLKDQRIIVTGGESAAGTYLNSCEIYNSGTWTNTTAMSTPRARHSAIILLNGNIMVIGGETTGGNPTATCEIWNGTDWTSVPAASMSTARSLHTATLLQSGRILVVGGMGTGGTALNNCEIYDPTSNTWTTETPITTARYAHNTTLLYSGLVLVNGGTDGTSYYSSCEIFDPGVCNPVTGLHQWKAVPGALANTKAYHASVLIPIDKPYILSIGGTNGSYLTPIERFDIGLGYLSAWQPTITNHSAVTTITDSMYITGTLFRGISEADGGNHCHTVSNDHPIISLVRVGGGNWQGNGGGEVLHMPMSSSWDTMHTTVHPQVADFQGYYRIWAIVNGIPSKWYPPCPTGVEENQNSNLKTQKIEVFPNPAAKNVNFVLQTRDDKKSSIFIDIYDLSGRLIRKLSTTNQRTVWDRKDDNGREVKAGMYFYSIKSGDFVNKGKFVILK